MKLPNIFKRKEKPKNRKVVYVGNRRLMHFRNQFIQAQANRLNAAWYRLDLNDPNAEYEENAINLRKLSRRLVVEDAFVKGYYNALITNVIGHNGARFVPKTRKFGPTSGLHQANNAELKRAWSDWTRYPTVNRQLDFCGVEKMALKTTAEDGETFINLVADREVNEYGIAMEFISADLLDIGFSVNSWEGKKVKIRQGIELDKWNRPVAYYFWNRHPKDKHADGPLKRIRYPALDLSKPGVQGGILHLFDASNGRPNQLRGFPWLTPEFNWLARLNQYLDAELIAAVMSSMTPGYITTDEGDATAYTEPTFTNVDRDVLTTDEDGAIVIPKGPEIEQLFQEPGTFFRLGPGERLEVPDFKRPNEALEPTAKLYLRAVASGLGVAYSTFTTDTSEESYASGRLGVIQERDHWKRIQSWFIRDFHMKIYEAWLRSAMRMPGNLLNVTTNDPRELLEVDFRPRGWKWADQLREIKAAVTQVSMGILPPSYLAEEFGWDFEETVKQIAADFEIMENNGLDPSKMFDGSTSVERPAPDGTRPAEEEE